jgi:cytochrome c-type biogenesis protein CcmE
MSRRRRRGILIAGALGVLAVAVGLVLVALRDSIVFFHTPSDLSAKSVPVGQRIRLGGLVATGSVKRGQGADVEFSITDTAEQVTVRYRGVLPDLFREGQGVVTEGKLEDGKIFRADTVLAKHDETYMPPEVAKALKEKGLWQHGAPPPATTAPQPVSEKK